MPLSKARNRERVKAYMRDRRKMLQPKLGMLQPKLDWLVRPNAYLVGHMSVCLDYDAAQPGNHWQHCQSVNPMLQPKLSPLPNGPDGRYRAN